MKRWQGAKIKSLQTLDLNLLKAFAALMDEQSRRAFSDYAAGNERRVGKIA